MLSEWADEIPLDVVHLDIRSRWVAPGPDGVYPVQFQCPFVGCEATFLNASDCDRHVTVQKHPKKRQGDAKNWLCRGRHTRVLYKKEGNEMVILLTMGVIICDKPLTFKTIHNSGQLEVCCIYAIVWRLTKINLHNVEWKRNWEMMSAFTSLTSGWQHFYFPGWSEAAHQCQPPPQEAWMPPMWLHNKPCRPPRPPHQEEAQGPTTTFSLSLF